MEPVRYIFAGLNNKSAPESIEQNELVTASNVDLDKNGRARLRKGLTSAYGGTVHSLWATQNEQKAFFVENLLLKMLLYDYSAINVTSLTFNDPMAYVEVNNIVVYSNGKEIGFIDGSFAKVMPTGDDGAALQPGTVLDFFNGRVYSGLGNVLQFSKAYRLYRDKEYCHVPLPSEIKMLAGLDNGAWLSCGDEIIFLRGRGPDEWKWEPKAAYGAIPGMVAKSIGEKFGLEGVVGRIAVFATDHGFCVGTDDGRLINVSENTVSYPAGLRGSLIIREQDGEVVVVGVMQDQQAAVNTYA